MIAVNMHEAKTRLSELVKAVEEKGETIVLQRHGKPVAEIRNLPVREKPRRNMQPSPDLIPTLAPGYDPAEPLSEDEWPLNCR